MEEPTNFSRITVSLLLLRVKPFTISNSNSHNYTTCDGKSPQQEQPSLITFTVTTTVIIYTQERNAEPFSVCLPQNDNAVNNVTLKKTTLETKNLQHSSLYEAEDIGKSVFKSSSKRVPLSRTSAFSKDYFCTLILLLLVLRQVTQTSYFQKNLRNNSSEDLNFSSSCT